MSGLISERHSQAFHQLLDAVSPSLYQYTQDGRRYKKATQILHDTASRAINARLAQLKREITEGSYQAEKYPALVDILLISHLKNPAEFTMQNVMDEVQTFIFAGHDTSGLALASTLQLVGEHPEVLRKIHQELDEVFGCNRDELSDVTMEQLAQLNYMECVIKEATRLHAIAPMFYREIRSPTDVAGHTLPAGTLIVISVLLSHYSHENWSPDPEAFRPERWEREEAKGRNRYAFLTFSAGPRNCIGTKFAMLEMKLVLAKLFYKYSVTSLQARDKLKFNLEITFKYATPIGIKFEKRDNHCN